MNTNDYFEKQRVTDRLCELARNARTLRECVEIAESIALSMAYGHIERRDCQRALRILRGRADQISRREAREKKRRMKNE